MKKRFSLIAFLVIVLLLSIVSSGYCLNWTKWGRGDRRKQLTRVIPFDMFYFGQPRTGASTIGTGQTAIPLTFSIVKVPLYGTKAMTIADGQRGQMITIIATNPFGGGNTATLTPNTGFGWSTILFDAVGEQVSLRWIDTYGWIVNGSEGATVTTSDE